MKEHIYIYVYINTIWQITYRSTVDKHAAKRQHIYMKEHMYICIYQHNFTDYISKHGGQTRGKES